MELDISNLIIYNYCYNRNYMNKYSEPSQKQPTTILQNIIPIFTMNSGGNVDRGSNCNNNPLNYYIKGAMSGMFGILLSHPIDTVKTHIQTGNSFKTFNPSITNFYKGLLSPLVGVGVEKALVFGTYNYLLRETDNIPLSGGIAGFTASLVVSPYERLKILKQSAVNYKWNNITPGFLFKGLSATFTREIPGFAIYFSVYEGLKYHTFTKHGKDIEYINSFLYGGISGITAWIFIYPQDRIKTILQSSIQTTDKQLSIKNIIKSLYNAGGVRTFYSGFSWAVMRAMLLHSGTFCMMEILNDLI